MIERVICEFCGKVISKINIKKHQRTRKCRNHVNNKLVVFNPCMQEIFNDENDLIENEDDDEKIEEEENKEIDIEQKIDDYLDSKLAYVLSLEERINSCELYEKKLKKRIVILEKKINSHFRSCKNWKVNKDTISELCMDMKEKIVFVIMVLVLAIKKRNLLLKVGDVENQKVSEYDNEYTYVMMNENDEEQILSMDEDSKWNICKKIGDKILYVKNSDGIIFTLIFDKVDDDEKKYYYKDMYKSYQLDCGEI